MAKRRYVSDNFRSDLWIENLDPLEKYLYLYLLTNQQVSICGIYEIQPKRIAYETGIDKEMVLKMLGRFQNDGKVFYNEGLLFIVNFVKNQSIKTIDDNLWKGVEREVKDLGSDKLALITQLEGAYKVVEGAYKDVPIPYFTLLYSTLPIGGEKPKKKSESTQPTIEQVKEYFIVNGYTAKSAERAYKYYSIANWHDSKGNKVKNWKQKMQAVWFKDENKDKSGMKTLSAEEIAERTGK